MGAPASIIFSLIAVALISFGTFTKSAIDVGIGQTLGIEDRSGSNSEDKLEVENEDEDQDDEDKPEVEAEDENEDEDEDEDEIEPSPLPAERIRIRTEDGRSRIDVTSGGVRVRMERRDDRLVIKAKQEGGQELELEESSLVKIEDRLAKSNLKITVSDQNAFVVNHGDFSATSRFPLSVDLSTNALTITTPSGEKQVAVLPEQAVRNLLAANVIDQVATASGTVADIISLGLNNNLPVYEIRGASRQLLLGFIPIPVAKTVTVSAETGEVIDTSQNIISSFLDSLAI